MRATFISRQATDLTAVNAARVSMGKQHDVFSIKGAPPEGATYSDGELITRPVNIAWRDGTTGEVFAIEYEVPTQAQRLVESD